MRSTPSLSPHDSRMRGTTQLQCEAPLVRRKATMQKLGYHLNPSRDIDDQRILQSDLKRGTTVQIQLKVLI